MMPVLPGLPEQERSVAQTPARRALLSLFQRLRAAHPDIAQALFQRIVVIVAVDTLLSTLTAASCVVIRYDFPFGYQLGRFQTLGIHPPSTRESG
jgi:hypothetical protein